MATEVKTSAWKIQLHISRSRCVWLRLSAAIYSGINRPFFRLRLSIQDCGSGWAILELRHQDIARHWSQRYNKVLDHIQILCRAAQNRTFAKANRLRASAVTTASYRRSTARCIATYQCLAETQERRVRVTHRWSEQCDQLWPRCSQLFSPTFFFSEQRTGFQSFHGRYFILEHTHS